MFVKFLSNSDQIEEMHPNCYVEYSSETGEYTVYNRLNNFAVEAVYRNVYSKVMVIVGIAQIR